MERIIGRLTAHLDAASDDVLRDTISILRDIQRRPDGPYPVSWGTLHNNFRALQSHGLWESSPEDDELVDSLRVLLTSSVHGPILEHVAHNQTQLPISVVVPSTRSISPQLISNRDLALPVELIDILNNAYFLHILATDSAQVLPPGKSLLSVMSRSHTSVEGDTKPALHSKVEDLVHRAFWDEVVDTLSNPEPSVQLLRIKLLYRDLHVALSPLLPPEHPVLVILSSPLSPTSSPLNSALMHLGEVLASLRERCAPVRDSEVEALRQPLADPPARPSALATLVAQTVRSILRVAEIMKDDLSQFFLGNMTEQQLKSVVAKQAKKTERELIIDIWHLEGIIQEWLSWVDKHQLPAYLGSISASPSYLWIARVVQDLGSSSPVVCLLPSRTIQVSLATSPGRDPDDETEAPKPIANAFPAVFFLSAPTLLKIQNYLQALVIAATLGALARLPVPTCSDSDPSNTKSFMFRVWTLLRAEIVEEPGASDTKLINLADEVIRAHTQLATVTASGPLTKEGETTLRAAVNRALRPEDPVYELLQRRLLTELTNALVKRRQGYTTRDVGTGANPPILRTGRGREPAGKQPGLVLDLEDVDESQIPPRGLPRLVIDIKGFEDPVLKQAAEEVFEEMDNCLWWVESVWSDIIDMGHLKHLPKVHGTRLC